MQCKLRTNAAVRNSPIRIRTCIADFVLWRLSNPLWFDLHIFHINRIGIISTSSLKKHFRLACFMSEVTGIVF